MATPSDGEARERAEAEADVEAIKAEVVAALESEGSRGMPFLAVLQCQGGARDLQARAIRARHMPPESRVAWCVDSFKLAVVDRAHCELALVDLLEGLERQAGRGDVFGTRAGLAAARIAVRCALGFVPVGSSPEDTLTHAQALYQNALIARPRPGRNVANPHPRAVHLSDEVLEAISDGVDFTEEFEAAEGDRALSAEVGKAVDQLGPAQRKAVLAFLADPTAKATVARWRGFKRLRTLLEPVWRQRQCDEEAPERRSTHDAIAAEAPDAADRLA